ncbi:hypothetical protein GF325_07125 [Candidatus Bathyarchaeota archaeon]|nr:hypothetical protein [Candidatus Bathyarchaeota archaeon]
MSYIPKYIMKRMFPKDAVKKINGGLEITMINVISPLSVDEVPDDVENYIEASIDGKPVDKEALKENLKITVDEDKSFTYKNAKEFAGYVIPVGGKIKIFVPVEDIEPGKEHEFEIIIKTDNPFQLSFTRKVMQE